VNFDPLSLSIKYGHRISSSLQSTVRRSTQAIDYSSCNEKDLALAHLWLGRSYQQLGRYDEALAEFRQIQDAFPGWPVSIAALGFVNAISNHKVEAERH
jgi:hypothetical protein